ncbi:MAG: phospholipase, partial [Pseudomonadota bacterium]|nr:phospholipase [Pseudomonadota bacterium]
MSGIDGPRRPPVGAAAAEALVILVHGYGADGNDLIDLASYWAEDLPAVAFVSPHAPDPCEMAPFGRQWFSLVDRSPAAMLAGVRGAAKILNDFIDAELARQNLTADKLALVGFSQGTMMSLFVGPRRERQIAGIV